MRITDVEVVPVAHREPRLRNSWGGHSDVAARTIIRLTTADGEVGVGETYGDQADAIERRLREMDLNVEFLEDPVPTLNAHRRLKRYVDYPIATNMYVTEFEEIAPAVRQEAVDVILADHHYWGGLSGNADLDRVARTFDLGVGMHSNSHLGVSMAAMAHVAAAMPTMRYACDSHYPWMADDVVKEPFEFEKGCITPEGPGLGVELDEAKLAAAAERYEESDPLAYSSVESMAAEYAEAMDDIGRSDWLPDKPRW